MAVTAPTTHTHFDMPITGYISDQDRAELNLYHGSITTDDLPFGGNNGAPFRIMLLQKPGYDPSFGPAIIDCRLLGDSTFGPFPVDDLRDALNNTSQISPNYPIWSEKNLVHIADTENVRNILENYHMYWSSGDPAPTNN